MLPIPPSALSQHLSVPLCLLHCVAGEVLKTGKSSGIKLKRPSGEAEDTSESGEKRERDRDWRKIGLDIQTNLWVFNCQVFT